MLLLAGCEQTTDNPTAIELTKNKESITKHLAKHMNNKENFANYILSKHLQVSFSATKATLELFAGCQWEPTEIHFSKTKFSNIQLGYRINEW